MGQAQSGSRYRIQPGGTEPGNTLGPDALRKKLEAARIALDEDVSGSDFGKHSKGQQEVKQEDRGPAASSAFLTENEAKALIGEEFWDPALYEANMDSNGNVAKADLRAVIQAAVLGDPPVSASTSTSAVASPSVATATPSTSHHVSTVAEVGAIPTHSSDTEEKFDIFAQDDGFAEMVDDDGLDSSDSDSDSDDEKNNVTALLQGGAQEGTATAAATSIATPSLAAKTTETAASTATAVATVTATVTEHVSKVGDLKRLTNVSDKLPDTFAAVGGKLSTDLQDEGSRRRSTLAKFRKKAKKAHTVETAFLLKSKDK